MNNNINVYQQVANNIKNGKKVVLIAGASASGKSYTAKELCNYLNNIGINAVQFSADNYYKGISKIIVEKAILNNGFNKLKQNKESVTNIIKSIIENSPFTEKFCENNKLKLYKELYPIFKKETHLVINELQNQFNQINFDEPFALNLNLLTKDINALINGKSIILPSYSFASGECSFNKNNILTGNYDSYIIEGLYVLNDDVLNSLPKDKICSLFINCDVKTLLSRRFNRDIKSGRTTYSPEQTIITTLTKTMPSYLINILPFKQNAQYIINTSLTSDEVNSKEQSCQTKYKLSGVQQLALKNLQPSLINKTIQTDYYFDDSNQNDSFVFRLRVENNKPTKISFKNNLENQRRIEEYDISNFSEQNTNEQNLVNKFLQIGLNLKCKITKTRCFYDYNNQQFKLDLFDDQNIYLEFDNKNNNLINLLNLKESSNLPYINLLQNATTSQIPKEKEFKFIVNKLPKNYNKKLKITQIYFNFNNKKEYLINNLKLNLNNVSSARVRVCSQHGKTTYFLTLKSYGGFVREEQEIEISKQTAIYLLKDNIISSLQKTRYVAYFNNLKFEFDQFKNNLLLCEVEVKNSSDYQTILQTFNSQNISFKDVTNNQNYKNENLAKLK